MVILGACERRELYGLVTLNIVLTSAIIPYSTHATQKEVVLPLQRAVSQTGPMHGCKQHGM